MIPVWEHTIQKFGNSFIFKLPKVGGNSVKNCDTFFQFSESSIKMTKRCPIEYQIAINSNIYMSKQSRSVILNWASLLHCLRNVFHGFIIFFSNTKDAWSN